MAVKVRIPTPLQRLTQGREEVEGVPGTIIALINDLETRYPGIAERISESGKVRRFVNVYVNEEDIRFLQAEQTHVKDGDEVSIVPAIAGGCAGKRGPRPALSAPGCPALRLHQ